MGSGHILVYAFDLFIKMYREKGYSDREAARLILERNIYGLDIDKRAFQLSYFALMMKARTYDRRILSKQVNLNIAEIIEPPKKLNLYFEGIESNSVYDVDLKDLLDCFKHSKEIGSLINPTAFDYNQLRIALLMLSIIVRKICFIMSGLMM